MEQKHIDSISHMTELHLIKIEDAIRINIQRVKEEEKEFYNEKEQQLIEKMKKSFSKDYLYLFVIYFSISKAATLNLEPPG